ncbi:hypothetical protein GWG65_15575 [Bradyrhizobium sp. CSA207]|uniref:hypothetical protein n=1 Tax=Bradyrhizobium sp. CSA207 TaxID=2698826 RepID=UPI0023AF2E4B|nr:hypothetical protein [Bradyrhizobium sp. CSA207]MDE5442845.1 hypothetical protein [Bradyrhizobium sp. CSA207]
MEAMTRLISVSLMLIVVLSGASVEAQVSANAETFTGLHRNEGVRGQPETVTVTDGKSFIRLTVQEYRAAGYWPLYEALPMIVVRRLPVRIPVPNDRKD